MAPATALRESATRSTPVGLIGRYFDTDGRGRELCTIPGAGGSTLVIDRDVITSEDQRLLAHLAPDEPLENAALVCRLYLEHPTPPRCRALRPEDLDATAPPDEPTAEGSLAQDVAHIVGRDGATYRLRPVCGEYSTAQLRWCRKASDLDVWERVSLRQVIAACESYEPARRLSELALAGFRDDPGVVLTRLHWELERLAESPIVLNRGLREAVLQEMGRRGTSMSDIAMRCGAVKRNRHGRLSGETSWLARRIGQMPEAGLELPTPWVHIDVLALIAREGLGISPREVELG